MPKVVDIAARRTQLTDAAARVIARSGIEAATLREVAAEAGWTTGAITHYFADKRTLLLATFEASLASRRGRRLSGASTTPAERLRASIEGALPVDGDRRRHWLVTLTFCTQANGDDQLAAAQRDAYREFRGHITELVIASQLATGNEAELLAERLIASADGIAIQALFDPASWPPQRQHAALDAMLAPLGV